MDLDKLISLRKDELHLVTEEDLALYPPMVSWFDPRLLFRLLRPVIISQIFGEYADRRLIHAALNAETDVELPARADLRPEHPEAPVWIDYVSDLGDGFDATYAIACLIAQPRLEVDGQVLPRGSLVVMGGDEVYPYATTRDYVLRMRHPYGLALPFDQQDSHPPMMLAIPGNHDWYDGLARFLAIFCRKDSTVIGGWRTRQRRSYFAARLSENWWLWGIDIALIEDMDQPQADYFRTMADQLGVQSSPRHLLCLGWLLIAEVACWRKRRYRPSDRRVLFRLHLLPREPKDCIHKRSGSLSCARAFSRSLRGDLRGYPLLHKSQCRLVWKRSDSMALVAPVLPRDGRCGRNCRRADLRCKSYSRQRDREHRSQRCLQRHAP